MLAEFVLLRVDIDINDGSLVNASPFQLYAALVQSPVTKFSVGSPEPTPESYFGLLRNVSFTDVVMWYRFPF